MVAKTWLNVTLVAFLISFTSALKLSSPCPNLFQYDSAESPNQWTGTLNLLSDADLHGVWVRVMFNGKIEELTVQDGLLEVVHHDDTNEFLIKNRDLVLKAGIPKKITLTAKYKSDKIATLAGYRLNAKMICPPEESDLQNFYPGDLDQKNFLFQVVSATPLQPSYQDFEACGKTPLKDGQYPWQSSVFIKNSSNKKFVCEGTLITTKHLLVPAHCITYRQTELAVPVTQLSVSLGCTDLKNSKNDKNVQVFGVVKITVHPGYRTRNLVHDLAVLELEDSVEVGDSVRPICLNQLTKNQHEIVVGYEIQKGHVGKMADAKINILSQEECLHRTVMPPLVSGNGICANYADESSKCVGSSGSSLVTARPGKTPVYELKGIVIAGAALQNQNECNASTLLFILDAVNYLKWIQLSVL